MTRDIGFVTSSKPCFWTAVILSKFPTVKPKKHVLLQDRYQLDPDGEIGPTTYSLLPSSGPWVQGEPSSVSGSASALGRAAELLQVGPLAPPREIFTFTHHSDCAVHVSFPC